MRRYDYLRPSRLVRFSLPSGALVRRAPLCAPPDLRRVRLACRPRPTADAWVLVAPVTHPPALSPKETGGPPEFPDCPFEHMPRSQTPVASRPLALARTGLLPSRRCILSAFDSVSRSYPLATIIHFSGFNNAACALAFPLLRTPPLGGRTSVRLPTRWLASDRMGLSGFHRLHPLGNCDEFQGVSPLFQRPELLSARASGLLDVPVRII
jgi:hypothetical protein